MQRLAAARVWVCCARGHMWQCVRWQPPLRVSTSCSCAQRTYNFEAWRACSAAAPPCIPASVFAAASLNTPSSMDGAFCGPPQQVSTSFDPLMLVHRDTGSAAWPV